MSRKQSFSLPGLKAQSSKLARHSGEGLWAKMGKQIAHLCYPELGVNCCSVEQTEEDVGYKSPQSPPALGGRFLQGAGTDSLSVQQQLLPAQGEGKKIPRNAINTFYKCWSWGLTKILQDIRKIAQVRCLWANFWFSEEFCTLRHWEVKPDLSTEEIHINIRDLHLHLWKPQRSGPGRVFFFSFFMHIEVCCGGEKKNQNIFRGNSHRFHRGEIHSAEEKWSPGERKGAGWENDHLPKIDQLCQAGWDRMGWRKRESRKGRGTEMQINKFHSSSQSPTCSHFTWAGTHLVTIPWLLFGD